MWRLEYAVTLLPHAKIAPMMQCVMGAIYTVMHVYCTYFYYSHSIQRILYLVHLFYLFYNHPNMTTYCGILRYGTGTAL